MKRETAEIGLQIRGLTKSYGDLVAVNNLSLEVFQGEIFGFLGPNGAGKTTTIHMVCGLLRCDAGDVFMRGKSLKKNPKWCQALLGLCPQNLVIWESLTCLEQLEFVAGQYDVRSANIRKRSLEILDLLGLVEKRNRLAKTLSGGMKRRLNIALGIIHDPDILILDEPQAGLDPQSRLLVRDYIRSLARKKTVILTTHEMVEADQISDRIGIIDHGQLLVLDTPENLKDQIGRGDLLEIRLVPGQEKKTAAFLEKLSPGLDQLSFHNDCLQLVSPEILKILPVLIKKLKHDDIKTEDIKIRKKTLEDVFISLTGRRLRE